jgi:AcrR family transcriptional regulator
MSKVKMTSRAEQRARTRERVLSVASRVVAKQGFVNARTADVARGAKLSHGAVFVHFPSRDELMLEVARRVGTRITDKLHTQTTDHGSLSGALGTHLRCIREDEVLYRRLLLEALVLPGALRDVWTGLQSAISFHIGKAADAEVRRGTIRQVPQHLLFNTWVGLVHHYLANAELFAPSGSVIEKHGSTLLAHFLELFEAPMRRSK